MDGLDRSYNILERLLKLIWGKVGELVLKHVGGQIAAIHPLCDQVDILAILNVLNQLGHIVSVQFELCKFVAHSQFRDPRCKLRALALTSGNARLPEDYLNSNFDIGLAMSGLDNSERTMSTLFIIDEILVNLA